MADIGDSHLVVAKRDLGFGLVFLETVSLRIRYEDSLLFIFQGHPALVELLLKSFLSLFVLLGHEADVLWFRLILPRPFVLKARDLGPESPSSHVVQ